ncbi:MAG TPA: BTAD domain-containing putative transcriptional regulator, partial [Phytomonospora sp.]
MTHEPAPLISLLGPVRLATGGGTSAGPPRQACVLAALALHAGRPVTMDTLTDRAWGDEPASRSALYTIIARLRRLLEPLGVGLTQHGGAYVLDLAEDRVDIHRMRDLAARARDGAPSTPGLLRQALALWRGEPLTGVRGDWAERVRVGLSAERLALYGRLYDAELAAGRHAEVVGELADLAARFPYDEPVTAHYLLALHRTGRTTEALAAFRGTRDLVRAELGVQPGRDLDDLHRRILRDDPALRADHRPAARPQNRPLPRQLPVDLSTFTGRAEALAELDAVLDDDGVPRAGLVAVTGSGGVGKTALAVHWAHRAARHFPDGQLYVDLRGFAQQAPAEPGPVLAAFLRGLGVGGDEIPAETSEKAALYRSLTAGRRLLILLDNAHDPAQVRPLLPG